MHTIAFTGHRPKDLPFGFGQQQVYTILNRLLHPAGDRLDEPTMFVTGGALGIDTWAAEYALDQGIGLTLVLPFLPDTMGRFWHEEDRIRLGVHRQMADNYILVGGADYNPANYQRRNERMVDIADEVFAFWSGKPFGGTANCINYATRVGKPIRNLLPGGPEFGS